ncbi:MAG: protochlorophyllide oxidoreductase [Phormidesmis sp. RL_2_1]|nr:protochlorophyllide oxidoreductase [Phormidesmis sp. RL_2_1]
MTASIPWSSKAETLLKEIPFFVRPAARKKIEKYAREHGLTEITETVYQQAKAQFGRKQ